MAKTGRPRVYGADWVGLNVKVPIDLRDRLTKICESRGVSLGSLVADAIDSYLNHTNPHQDKGDSLKSAKVDLNQLKFHPVAFAAGQYPTTPIHPEVLRSRPTIGELKASLGMTTLGELSRKESAELDQAGIPPMPVDWDDAPDGGGIMGDLIAKWEARLAKWRSRGETGQTEMVEELGQRVSAKLARIKPQLQAEFLASEVGEPA